jgi:hypothetical protein
MKSIVYPCPHNRTLTDQELERIATTGWAQWKREQDRERRRQDAEHDDADWWKKQD